MFCLVGCIIDGVKRMYECFSSFCLEIWVVGYLWILKVRRFYGVGLFVLCLRWGLVC